MHSLHLPALVGGMGTVLGMIVRGVEVFAGWG